MSLPRVAAVWAVLAVLMSANGAFREAVLKNNFSVGTAGVMSAALGIVLILLVTAVPFRPLAREPLRKLVVASVLLFVLTVVFEFTIGLTVDGKSWTELAGNYAIWRGELWPLVLLVVVLTPFIWGRWYARGGVEAR